MARKHILHMLTPLKQMSPFDVNMALDAGFDAVVPYVDVGLAEVTGLVQDAIFSRPPDAGVDTGIFIAGKDASLALDMFDAAKKAMVPPFQVSVFADPAGSFTTAAAMVAKVEKALEKKFQRALRDTRVAVFGATGVVGFCTAVIAAGEGARVTLVGHDGIERVKQIAAEIESRFHLTVDAADGSSDARKTKLVEANEIILACAKAGVQVVSKAQLKGNDLLIAADVNAVPPAGIEGLAVNANGDPLDAAKAVGIGPLAIGNVKYKVEFGLFKRMIESEKTITLGFQEAFSLAREIAK
ncbi:NAD(P)-dependent methylenetetrahydromethanopterin dehydrogenase [Mesorhizobium ciceri]|uniref:Methylene-tetrahydromethanopterin dehydrogenase n=11 Tax=Mesorhizobium TaxID=68287 RepID=E8TE75_MESCW|nr:MULTISPECIES: NAD(P)-dependent methylenetetrahydromethanopterin dehydrogenase [Mesorhizobium]ADV13368.1 Methylene-tetrahydromethanopterin dehydrogenase [Mesorhizobium ciceri biovar biserrulae WSM1271]AMX92643.1 methylenetetrahydromethanopterin dehydrogenase [Mesorhizobium ciceri]AMY00172.1 methylenetetrahydromethanopterin dehydrogenase [Mesorhizobium ciceri biovar biserrulae]ARP65992.1 methylenetetrahydromethanopterin dehydrogenase [Mesorhizobium sp. WSM1497]MBZ9717964.1 methylenetetrahydro